MWDSERSLSRHTAVEVLYIRSSIVKLVLIIKCFFCHVVELSFQHGGVDVGRSSLQVRSKVIEYELKRDAATDHLGGWNCPMIS